MPAHLPGGAPTATANPASFHGKTPPAHVALTMGEQAAHWMTWLLSHAAQLRYSMAPGLRSELFHQEPGVAFTLPVVHADCSQTCAAALKWAGAHKLTDQDWTGTLLKKGREIKDPHAWQAGDGVICGPGAGRHAAMLTGPVAGSSTGDWDWIIVGFGGDPIHRGLLQGTAAWFAQDGYPGIRVLRFA